MLVLLLLLLNYEIGAQFFSNLSLLGGGIREKIPLTDEILFPKFEGLTLSKGVNSKSSLEFFVLEESDAVFFSTFSDILLSYPTTDYETGIILHKLNLKTNLKFLSFSFGKDNVTLGQGGHNRIILSDFIPPQRFARVELGKDKVPYIGWLYFTFGLLFINDESQVQIYKNPKSLFLRFEWTTPPYPILTVGASKISNYGGVGGREPKGLKEWFDFITARLENALKLCEGKTGKEYEQCREEMERYNYNQAAAWDVSLDIKELLTLFDSYFLKEGRIYLEHGGDDIAACWQVEDVDFPCFPVPFRFFFPATIFGFYFLTDKNLGLSFEYSRTLDKNKRLWYSHSAYPLAVSSRYFGLHTGPDSDDFFSRLVYMKGDISGSLRFHFTRIGVNQGKGQGEGEHGPQNTIEVGGSIGFDIDKRNTFGVSLNYFHVDNLNTSQNPFGFSFTKRKSDEFLISTFFLTKF